MTACPVPDGAPLGRTLMAGTVSVVIGGSAGIGLAAAWALARHGSAVELAAIDPPGVDRAAGEMRAAGHEARGTVLDVADPGQIASFMAGVADRHGRLSVLVNSAGIQRYGTVETTPVSVWDEVLDVNVRGMFLAAGQAVPLMRRSRRRRHRERGVRAGHRNPAQRGRVHGEQGRHRRHDQGHGGRSCPRRHPGQLGQPGVG